METNKIPESMKAATIKKYGGVNEFEIKTLELPEVAEDEVLVKVDFAGIGVWDTFEREGGFDKMYKDINHSDPNFPYIIGTEGAGTIVKAGGKVKDLREGQNVFGAALLNKKGGFYAEYIALKEDQVFPVPKDLDKKHAAVMFVDADTAWVGLNEVLEIKNGETVLVFGSSGGVGHLAVQIAKARGCKVAAVASGDDGVKLMKDLNCDFVVDGHREEALDELKGKLSNGVDAALFTAGGKEAYEFMKLVKNKDRIAMPEGVELEAQNEVATVKTYNYEPKREIREDLISLVENGKLCPYVAKTFEIDDVQKSHKAINSHFLGKMALKIH